MIYHAAVRKSQIGAGQPTLCNRLSGSRKFQNCITVSAEEWKTLRDDLKCKSCLAAIKAQSK